MDKREKPSKTSTIHKQVQNEHSDYEDYHLIEVHENQIRD